MNKYLFETWINNATKHNTISFNDLQSVLRFASDFVGEHTAWGEWVNNCTYPIVMCLKTTGNNKGEFYNLLITTKK